MVENSLSNKNHQHQQQHQQHQSSSEDGEQPAKFLKVFNCSSPTAANGIGGGAGGGGIALHENFAANVVVAGQKVILTNNLVAGGGCGNVVNTNLTLANGKMLTNGNSATTTVTTITGNELCRLPGGAELNILPPTSSSCNTLNTVTSVTNGHKIGGPTTTTTATSTALATAFYHANGKITFVGPPQMNGNSSSSSLSASVSSVPHGTATVTANGILLKGMFFCRRIFFCMLVINLFSFYVFVLDASSMAATTNGSTSLTPSTSAASPLISTTNINGLHFTGNFAQLLAAANSNTTTLSTSNGGSANASNNYANISAIESSPSKVNSKVGVTVSKVRISL